MADYKDTLNLPKTAFPMRGDLAKREPQMLERWRQIDVYGRLRAARKGRRDSPCTTARPTPMAKSTSAMR